MLDFEQTQNKGQMHLCQTTRLITKFGALSIIVNRWKEKIIAFQNWSKQGKPLPSRFVFGGVILCLLLALVLRLLSFYIEPVISRDGTFYVLTAEKLIAEDWNQEAFTVLNGNFPTFFYISYLASNLFDLSPYHLAIGTNILLGSLLPLIFFLIVRKLFKNDEVALAAALMCAVHPTLVEYSIEVQRESIYLFCSAVFVLFMVYFWNDRKWYWCVGAGGTVALAFFFRFEGIELCIGAIVIFAIVFGQCKAKRRICFVYPMLFAGTFLFCSSILILWLRLSPFKMLNGMVDKLSRNIELSITVKE